MKPFLQGIVSPLRIASILATSVLCACGGTDSSASKQAVARVNDKEISVHQINFVAQRLPANLPAERISEARKSILKGLVEQETLVQYASENKLDRDAQVMQQLDSARREILARAAIERMGAQAVKPTSEEVRAFYDTNPELFRKRRVYRFDEIVLPGTPVDWNELEKRLAGVRSLREADSLLRTRGIDAPIAQGVSRTTESLPMAALPEFMKRRQGEIVIWRQPPRIVIGQLMDIKESPVDSTQAVPVIEQFLATRKRQEMINAEVKRLNEAAKVSYFGEFASDTKDEKTGSDGTGSSSPAVASAAPPDGLTSLKTGSAADAQSLARGIAGLK